MASEAMQKEFSEERQRVAVTNSTWEASLKKDELQIHPAFRVRLGSAGLDFGLEAMQEDMLRNFGLRDGKKGE